MKTITQNNYSLFQTEKFCKKLHDKTNHILNSYFKIIMEYLQYMFENIKIKNINYYRFILIRGIETINNVFNHILFTLKIWNSQFSTFKNLFIFM